MERFLADEKVLHERKTKENQVKEVKRKDLTDQKNEETEQRKIKIDMIKTTKRYDLVLVDIKPCIDELFLRVKMLC